MSGVTENVLLESETEPQLPTCPTPPLGKLALDTDLLTGLKETLNVQDLSGGTSIVAGVTENVLLESENREKKGQLI